MVIKNAQSRDTGNTGHIGQRSHNENKQSTKTQQNREIKTDEQN